MRKIEFRAWLKKDKKMVEVKSIHFGTKNIVYSVKENSDRWGFITSKFDDCKLMQFTGLTDKNGKQIFEGDILRLCDATYPCEIYWSGIGWAFKRNDKRVDYNYGSSLVIDCEKMQVIGNIYDNPELLGGAE